MIVNNNYYPTVSLDIETKCNVSDCEKVQCNHGLNPFTSDISCIGVWYESENRGEVFRDLEKFKSWLNYHPGYHFVGHNFKFDLYALHHNGIDIPLDRWRHDTHLMALADPYKVDQGYLSWYEELRKKKNSDLPKGVSHREGKKHSLKVLAPYYLKVDPFWENPMDHDSDEYVLKDCKYTAKLETALRKRLLQVGAFNFYEDYLLPWTKVLLQAEMRGVKIDLGILNNEMYVAEGNSQKLKEELRNSWGDGYKQYRQDQIDKLKATYEGKCKAAIKRLKKPTVEKIANTDIRYKDLYTKAVAKVPLEINLESPKQLTWLFKDYLGLDITNFNKDNSTAKAVLQRLAGEGREDIKTFLEYRRQLKKMDFCASYKEKHHNGILHCSFNPGGTKTGRLSSSKPNLQQVDEELRSIFVARPGYKLICRDMSSIEAMLIGYYTEDPVLLDLVFQGHKLHGYNASLYFPYVECHPNEVKSNFPVEYKFAKTLGYALFYGAGKGRIEQTALEFGFTDWDEKTCAEAVSNFRNKYQKVMQFKKGLDELALNQPIKNIFGRQRFFADREDIYMQNFNSLVQGTASDLVQESAKRFCEKAPWANVLLEVHDEIVAEVPEDRAGEGFNLLHQCMTSFDLMTSKGRIPLNTEGEIADCWSK
jgi:DNA polymerase I-like protein with 3'-5' exonuclease and polymerase domains